MRTLKWLRELFHNNRPLSHWVILFWCIQIILGNAAGTNSSARYTTLVSMAEEGTFKINTVKDWSIDWSQTPDGNYYSNKAPGPMLIGFPLFWILDSVSNIGILDSQERQAWRWETHWMILHLMSLLLQALPFGILALLLLEELKKRDYSFSSQQSFLLAFLFGNTAIIFMNTYFGHGFAAVWSALLFLSLLRRHFVGIGLSFGCLLLSDYGASLVLPILIVYLLSIKINLKSWGYVMLGGLLPGLLWTWYHTVCFGNPWSLPNKYINPSFLDLKDSSTALWGIIDILPSMEGLWGLLFGLRRSIFITQPWIFVLFAYWLLILFKVKNEKWTGQRAILSFWFFSFLAALWINASFGGWHGGASSGPRYLSFVLAPLAWFVADIYDRGSKSWRIATFITLFYSLIMFALIYSTSISGGNGGVASESLTMPSVLADIFLHHPKHKPFVRASVILILTAIVYYTVKKFNDSKLVR